MDPWRRTSTARSDEQSSSVAGRAITHYGLPHKKFCQILGPKTPHVVNLHIWPEWAVNQLRLLDLGFEAIDDPRNILRVHTKVERSFDRKELTFVIKDGRITLKVLCPRLKSEVLDDTTKTFAAIDGSELIATSNTPYRRLLAVHSIAAHKFAESEGWILGADRTEEEIRAMNIARLSLGDSDAMEKVKYFFRSESASASGLGALSNVRVPVSSTPLHSTGDLISALHSTNLNGVGNLRKRGGRGRQQCYGCRQFGHIKRDCPNSKARSSADNAK